MNFKLSFQALVSALTLTLAASAMAQGWPGAGPGSPLDNSARGLSFAAQSLENELLNLAPGSLAAQNAQTLYYATQHFQEEVELGPEDLDVDFQNIEDTYLQLAQALTNSGEYRALPSVRNAWFRVEEANINLRSIWTNTPVRPRGYECEVRNLRGELFTWSALNLGVAQNQALNECRRVSLVCSVIGCHPL